MTATHFSGPLMVGDKITGETLGPNQGYVIMEQAVGIAQNSTTAVSGTIYVPKASIILDIYVDILTAFNSAVSATLSVGSAAAGTQYASGVDVKTATGRIRPTFTAAQLAAMANISVLGVAVSAANQVQTIVSTVTPSGATSAGYVRVTIVYAQVA